MMKNWLYMASHGPAHLQVGTESIQAALCYASTCSRTLQALKVLPVRAFLFCLVHIMSTKRVAVVKQHNGCYCMRRATAVAQSALVFR